MATQNYYTGCNVWGDNKTTLNNNAIVTQIPFEYEGTIAYNLPLTSAYLNTYLNTDYYNGLINKDLIADHSFNIGHVLNATNETLSTDIVQESKYTWRGKIALMNISDYIKASTDSAGVSVKSAKLNDFPCKNNNYLYNYNENIWTINPPFSIRARMWIILTIGKVSYISTNEASAVYPVLYLKSEVKLFGLGTIFNPYVLK